MSEHTKRRTLTIETIGMIFTMRFCPLKFLSLALLASTTSVASAASLVPHRAVYDISLLRADDGASVADASGRMVFELTGSACDGYSVNYRFVTKLGDNDGSTVVTDFRVTTFEEPEGSSFSFASSNFVNNDQVEEVRGHASREDSKVSVDLTKPEDEEVLLSGEVLFPTQQFEGILKAAENGEKLVQHLVFDGSEQGKKMFDATSIIGARSVLPNDNDDQLLSQDALSKTPFWPVTISYFDQGAGGELLPNYVTSFDMHDNGISRNITMDYGDMALKATLSDLEVLDAGNCN
ncbi:MAG: cell envelope integrity EipB family protein [Hyphomicrobiales bacterium]